MQLANKAFAYRHGCYRFVGIMPSLGLLNQMFRDSQGLLVSGFFLTFLRNVIQVFGKKLYSVADSVVEQSLTL